MSQLAPQNELVLLHSGRDYFPALLSAIAKAQHSIALEAYIFANDATGLTVRDALIQAAQRGVQVRVTLDGFGSGDDGRQLVAQLCDAGIEARIYRPERWWQLGLSPKLLRRLHRKLCVIDGDMADVRIADKRLGDASNDSKTSVHTAVGFVGGINVLDDHNHAPHSDLKLGPRFDFAVQVRGDLVHAIHTAMHQSKRIKAPSLRTLLTQPAALVLRDNWRNRHSIHTLYLKHLASARDEVWIANAYFLPGRKLRHALIACAQRGVAVHLLLQGRVEYWLQHHATQALYGQLLAAGIQIYEYQDSFLHAKVAVFDARSATVGSSNIDPFSLLMAKEANVWVNDTAFASELRQALQSASQTAALQIAPQAPRPMGQRLRDWLAYGVLRMGLRMVIGRRY